MNWIEYRINEARDKQLPELDLSVSYISSRGKDSQDILTEFPQAILDLAHLTKLNLRGHKIKSLPEDIHRLADLKELSLANNRGISRLNQLSKLPQLTHLDLSNAAVDELPVFEALPALQVLNLSYRPLRSVPSGVFKLQDLNTLEIVGCGIPEFPERLRTLKNLRRLRISAGHGLITMTFPAGALSSLARAVALEELSLSGDKIGESTLEEIANFSNLEALHLDGSYPQRIPKRWLQLQRLKSLLLRRTILSDELARIEGINEILNFQSLEELSLDGVSSGSLILGLPQLTKLKSLTLNDVGLNNFPEEILTLGLLETLKLWDISISRLPNEMCIRLPRLRRLTLESPLTVLPDDIGLLNNLESLWLPNTALTKIPPSLARLERLKICSLYSANLCGWPEEIFELRQLETLTLARTGIGDIPESLTRLKKLERLDLSGNAIREIPSYIMELERLKELNVGGNPIETPPPEIVARGTAAVQGYFSALAEEKASRLYEAKLIVVGEGEVGKTCVARKLVEPGYDIEANREEIATTRGIAIEDWRAETEVAKDFKINVWDFGGQEIYHATHQFFLTRRSLYLFVWDARKEDRLGGFDYWLNVVRLLSGDSPVFIVLNKSDIRIKEIDQGGLKAKFPNIIGFHKVSALTGMGMPELTRDIMRAIVRLPHVGDEWPATWSRVRKRLKADARNYIDYEEYLAVCREEGLAATQADLLSTYLHDLGVILHFQDDPLLGKIVILKPDWGTNAVYAVLDTRQVQERNGRFSFKDLGRIWGHTTYPASKHAELLQLMIRFELCFRLENSQNYIAPELLSTRPPRFEWDGRDNLRFEYHYEFMPAGILSRFIARNHELIESNRYWRNGVVLAWEATRALVTSDALSRKIQVAVVGESRRELLAIVRREMEHIHKTLNYPAARQMIPCVCSECRAGDPFFFEYQRVRRFWLKDKTEIVCDKSVEAVPISKLLTGVFTTYEIMADSAPDPEAAGARVFHVQNYYEGRREDMTKGEGATPRSPWVSGSFFLLTAVVMIVLLAAVAKVLSYWVLPVIIVGGLLLITVVGALQMRQDERLSERGFLELMALSFRQIPLLGRAVKLPPGDGGGPTP